MLAGRPEWNILTKKILDACFEVHRQLGPGLLESVYEGCLAIELAELNVPFERQKPIPVIYKGQLAAEPFRLDFFVNEIVVVELKATEKLLPIYYAQLLTYLKLTKAPIGLIVNFNTQYLKDGIKRMIHELPTPIGFVSH